MIKITCKNGYVGWTSNIFARKDGTISIRTETGYKNIPAKDVVQINLDYKEVKDGVPKAG